MRTFKHLGLLAACTIGYAVSAHAGVAASAGVNGGGSASQIYDYGVVVNDQVHARASLPNDAGNASASAAYGLVMVSGKGSTSAYASNSGAQAGYTDSLRLDNAALTGKTGMVTLAFYIDYDSSVGMSGNGYSNGSLSFLARAGGSNYSWILDYASSDDRGYLMYEYRDPYGQGRTYGVPASHYLYVTTNFTWGYDFNTSLDLQTSIGASVPGTGGGTASYDLAGAGYWAGIVSATADGVRVSDYTLSSLSGRDYSQSFAPSNDVPEPATAAIFLAGLALLGIQRARKN